MNSPKYKIWSYTFLLFVLFFMLLNLTGGRAFMEAVVRSMISSAILELLIYLVYVIIFKKKDEKVRGNFFDKKDSDK